MSRKDCLNGAGYNMRNDERINEMEAELSEMRDSITQLQNKVEAMMDMQIE